MPQTRIVDSLGPPSRLVFLVIAGVLAVGGRHPLADEAAELDGVRAAWMRPTKVVPKARIDREGLAGRVLCGYQGWFNAEGDGADLQWHHWLIRDPSLPGGTRPGIDMLPDVGELGLNERFASDLAGADGRPVELFSSYVRPTVLRHFRWMRDYGIDGVFVQRFGVALRDPKRLAHFTKVLGSCRDGALEHGRVYAVMYDLTGMEAGSLGDVLEDWRHLRRRMKIGSDAAALRIVGRPLVAVWGIGFGKDREYTLDDCRRLVMRLKADGCSVLCGVPTGWRSLDRDSTPDPRLHDIISMCDVVCPWTVGRYATPEEAVRHAERSWAADMEWCRERNISYLPVVFPGFSWHNRKGGKLDQIPRQGGRFLWTQAVEARRVGADALYVAMFDEVDEGTAIFKCIDPPTPELAERFIGMEHLPSDHYLRLTGEIGRLLRNERPARDGPPAFVPMP